MRALIGMLGQVGMVHFVDMFDVVAALGLFFAFADALFEAGDAFANFTHKRGNLAAAEKHQHDNRDQQQARQSDIVQHVCSPIMFGAFSSRQSAP